VAPLKGFPWLYQSSAERSNHKGFNGGSGQEAFKTLVAASVNFDQSFLTNLTDIQYNSFLTPPALKFLR
jgi:hypothetical protein